MICIMKEMVGGCCVCSDERGWPENPLVYCDGQGCTVAVHQACYGIVTVPTGPWYCRKCESQERSARVRCELCPSKDGALKRTDNSGWAHVVCALYIPEVRFGNVTTMEPIILQLIPTERFNKVCYICEELGKGSRSTVGACMQCNKSGCKQQFHVTCAQALGLLCEEAGNYLDNVKYCGYCQYHYSKLKKSGNVKTIPPYKPIPTDNHSSDSSPEKEAEANAITTTTTSSNHTTTIPAPLPKTSSQQSTGSQSSTSGSSSKRKSSSSNSKSSSSSSSSSSKSSASKSSASSSSASSGSTGSHQKTVHHHHHNSTGSSTKNLTNHLSEKTKNFSATKKSTDPELNSHLNQVSAAEVDNKNGDNTTTTNHHQSNHQSNQLNQPQPKLLPKEINAVGSHNKFPGLNSAEGIVEGGFGAVENSTKSDGLSSVSVNSASVNNSGLNSVKETVTVGKGSKKRKAGGSRTPTPNSIGQTEGEKSGGQGTGGQGGLVVNSERRDSASVSGTEPGDKPKKLKTDHPIQAPTTAPTAAASAAAAVAAAAAASASISSTPNNNTRSSSSPSVVVSNDLNSTTQSLAPNDTPTTTTTTTTSSGGHPPHSASLGGGGGGSVLPHNHQPNSLVVSVPLASASLSPIAAQVNHVHGQGGAAPGTPLQTQQHHQQAVFSHGTERTGRCTPMNPPQTHNNINNNNNNGTNDPTIGISTSLDSTMVSSESSDGLKIAYEKQPTLNSSSLSRLSSDNASSAITDDAPAKRSRSQSADKSEKVGRPKKRGSNGVTTSVSGPATGVGKRASRSQHATPPPPTLTPANVNPAQPGAFSSVTQQQQHPHNQAVKESPPSSPSDESNSVCSGRRTKGRKSAPATITSAGSTSANPSNSTKNELKDVKDVKVFQNGVHAPHMLGNQLNPNSNMAQKMSDHLNSELEAHSIFNAAENNTSNLVGPQLHSRVIASIRSNASSASVTSNSSSGFSSMLGGSGTGNVPQTLDQLLERQWEQGSQFLMEQAQHFDIASLLSCLHQLRAENLRLEEHVNSLLQRRDHLLAVNARLAIPLTNQQPVAAPSQPHTLNNLHPSVSASHGDVPRSRHSSGSSYGGHTGAGAPPLENGLPPDGAAYPHQHRSPANSQPQPSPTIRHSPASGSYPSTSSHGVVRSGSSSEGGSTSSSRSSQRSQSQSQSQSQSHSQSQSQPQQSQSYPQYQGQVPVVTAQQQPQMVIRRESDVHHQMASSKPS